MTLTRGCLLYSNGKCVLLQLSLGIEDGVLQAYNMDFELQFAHHVHQMARFSQADVDPATFLYLMRDDADHALYCYLFQAHQPKDVSAPLFSIVFMCVLLTVLPTFSGPALKTLNIFASASQTVHIVLLGKLVNGMRKKVKKGPLRYESSHQCTGSWGAAP